MRKATKKDYIMGTWWYSYMGFDWNILGSIIRYTSRHYHGYYKIRRFEKNSQIQTWNSEENYFDL